MRWYDQMLHVFVSVWVAVAHWFADDRKFPDFNPRNLGKFVYPTLPVSCVFRLRNYKPLSLLYGAYARGSKDPTQGVNV